MAVLDWLRAAEVDDFVFDAFIEGGDEAGDDVVDVGPVAFELAVAVEGDGFAGLDHLGPHPGHHVRAAVGAVDVEESEDCCREIPEMVIAVCEQFHGPFAGGVGGEGAIGGGGFFEGDGGVLAVG